MAGLPKATPNQARLITVPETALEMIEAIGSGAFGTVFKVRVLASRKVQNSMLGYLSVTTLVCENRICELF